MPLFIGAVVAAHPSESSSVKRVERGADAERRSSPWRWGAIQRWHGLRLIHSSTPDAKRIVPRNREYDFIRQSGAETESANWQGRKTPTDEPRVVATKQKNEKKKSTCATVTSDLTKRIILNQLDEERVRPKGVRAYSKRLY